MTAGIADYGTFFPLWATVLHRTTGPVFEMGCGHYSTPTTHFMAKGRKIVSAETDLQWLAKFSMYNEGLHQFNLVEKGPGENKDIQWRAGWLTYLDALLGGIPEFGCALIDGFPGEIRVDVAKRLKDHCRLQVWHDVEGLDVNGNDGGNYRWEDIIDTFKYKFIWKEYRPWTAVVSDVEDFKP